MAFYICTACEYGSASWMGKCPNCGGWNTFVEKPAFLDAKDAPRKDEPLKKFTPTSLSSYKSANKKRISTGIFEFDRVLGGGFIQGEVIFLSGEPGVGKSTLLLQSLSKLHTLYISGEESIDQVKDRALRLQVPLNKMLFSDITQVESIIAGLLDLKAKPEVVVIDSIQTVYSKNIESPPGSVSQLKETASKLTSFAKQNNTPIILIGHITKDGDIAGPKTLEHLVDCVLNFEGERISNFRVLRASKNRFGSTDEIGIFEMLTKGLQEVTNPLAFIDQDKNQSMPGKAVIGVSEGKRPLFYEIQTLVVPTVLSIPRRIVKGVDYNKVQLLLAVMKKHLSLQLDSYDIYVNVIGGVKVLSSLSDLGIICSLYSSLKNIPLSDRIVFIGEVGLLGEIRKNYGEEKIIKEAKRLGFSKIYSYPKITNIKAIKSIIV